ncbi:MAG TPA: DUF1360 domain-containing protein [Pilimelia sp.]|nr:DUF1360 domain-containing protein [Pilimelia sp.]
MSAPAVLRRAGGRLRGLARAYAPQEHRPLGGYTAELLGYGALVGAVALAARARRVRLPERLSAADVALLSVATHKLSRLLAKDAVTSPLRAPLVRYAEAAGPGEVNEEVRHPHGGLRHALAELVTCPFCLGVWIATVLTGGLLVAPRLTRLAASGLTAVTASDFLQFAFSAAERCAEPPASSGT